MGDTPDIRDYILGRADYKGWRCRVAVARVVVFGKGDRVVSAEGDLESAFEDIKRQIDDAEYRALERDADAR